MAAGEQEGHAFSFDRPEARIGRTDDNDVVLDEPGVSRLHARVYEDAGRYFAEDMGSANGTKVNGAIIQAACELQDGDSVAVGRTVLAFTLPRLEKEVLAEQETRLLAGVGEEGPPPESATQVEQPAYEAPASTPPSEPPSEPPRDAGAAAPLQTDTDLPSVAAPGDPTPSQVRAQETRLLDRGAVGAESGDDFFAQGTEPPPSGDGELEEPEEGDEGDELQTDPLGDRLVSNGRLPPRRDLAHVPRKNAVAEDARRRRLASKSLGGQLRYVWEGLTPGARMGYGALVAVLLLGTVGGISYAFWPDKDGRPALGPEPTKLSHNVTHVSFGLGEGVDYRRSDLKGFTFDFSTATRAVAVLHYQAKDISSDEVNIVLNGAVLGSVPADTLDAGERELEQLLPLKLLKRGGLKNELVFDNLHNPPHQDTWRVWNLWLEVIPIPELPEKELLASAKDYFAKGREFVQQRDVGAENLFSAWKNFRIAWLMLESVDHKPEMYDLVRFQLASTSRELDILCGRLMLDARKAIELKKRPLAKQRLEEVYSYFPTKEHRCHNLAEEKLQDLY